jgi:benzoyl-CoA reductase/2-hydroxyglutaryl-CoA dehydratase subunit BcrC/BadD/HgdB
MSDQGGELFVEGVTAERLAELHEALEDLLDVQGSNATTRALRDALHFYDLTRKAWQECGELRGERDEAIRDAAGLLQDGYRVDVTSDAVAFDARVKAWLAQPVVVAAKKAGE